MTMVPLEEDEQATYTQWLDIKKIRYFAVPNVVKLAGALKTKKQKIRFWQQRKKEGVKKGVPDLVVFLPKCMLFVEMKRTKGSSTSDEQAKWVEFINKFDYAEAVIAKGAEAAIKITESLLKKPCVNLS